MKSIPTPFSRTAILLLAIALTISSSASAQGERRFSGRSLADVLRDLQAAGLRIVFTSATVTPDLRVAHEPRSASPRRQLDELLSPHGLVAREGPRGILQIVRAEPTLPQSAEAASRDEGTIEGRVIHALTSAPLAGAMVWVDGIAEGFRTDVAGRFVVRHVGAGTRTVRAEIDGFVPLARAVRLSRAARARLTFSLSPVPTGHAERVVVTPPWPSREDEGVVSETRLDRDLLQRFHGSLADDPMAAVHTLPGVSAIDEFRSEFAARGSPFRHAGVVIDGVPTEWLQHTVHARGAAGSIAMLASPIVEQATLSTGTYPHRYDDRLGPQLELRIREGSRDRFALRGAVGGTSAMVVGEGPLGRGARGSWLVAARRSYSEWPSEQVASSRTAFGFADAVGKIVYDVRPTHRLDVSMIGGTSNIDADDDASPNGLGGGTNTASLINVGWRTVISPVLVVSQRAYLARQRFVNEYHVGGDHDRGLNEDIGYRADVRRSMASAMFEGGVQVTRRSTRMILPAADAAAAGTAWLRSAYVHATWSPTEAVTLSPGLRIAQSTLLRDRPTTRWLIGQWAFRPAWTVRASAGVAYQFPEPLHLLASTRSRDLRPERAAHVDVGIERRVSDTLRWQATVFHREERDVLRDPAIEAVLPDVRITSPAAARYVNALRGRSRGIELLVERHSASALSGWFAYTYGKTRYTDVTTTETFWADFDQRHTFSLFGLYRMSDRTTLGVTFRAGSNFPIPGYFEARDDGLFVGRQRNTVRLPGYARLDVRADRQFQCFGRRLTFFAEVLNVMNRANVALAKGSIDPSTGAAVGFTETIAGRRGSGGVVVEF